MLSISAFFGGLVASVLTGFVNPYVCFGVYSLFGLIVSFTSLKLSTEIEESGDFVKRTFCEECKFTYTTIRDHIKEPALYRSLIYFILLGLTVPSFDEFMYYFMTEEVGFSQFTYSMLILLGAGCLFIGILMY